MDHIGLQDNSDTHLRTGRGPTIILLHGIVGHVSMWQDVVNGLKSDFQIIVPHLPIFNLPIAEAHVKYLSKLLYDFIDENRLTNVILIGHAIGGQLALLYANLHPQNVQKLILISCAGLTTAKLPFFDADAKLDSYEYVNEKLKEGFYQQEYVSKVVVEEIYSAMRSVDKRVVLQTIARSSNKTNVSSLLNEIHCQVLLIWGLQDPIAPFEAALHFHDLLPNAEVKFIDECGHFPMLEKAEDFKKHIVSFLKDTRQAKHWYS